MRKWYRKKSENAEGESETARPSSSRFQKMPRDKPSESSNGSSEAYQKALGMLVKREHSRKEIQRKLNARGIGEDDVDAALENLSRSNFQSDERFAEALARTRAGSGFGPVRIRTELGTHGISRELIDEAMESISTDFSDTALRLLSRKFSAEKLKDPAQRRKAVDFLLRRGFEQRMVYATVKQLGSSADQFDED
jgi:regulatory protein